MSIRKVPTVMSPRWDDPGLDLHRLRISTRIVIMEYIQEWGKAFEKENNELKTLNARRT